MEEENEGDRRERKGPLPAGIFRELLWLFFLVRVVSLQTETSQCTQLSRRSLLVCITHTQTHQSILQFQYQRTGIGMGQLGLDALRGLALTGQSEVFIVIIITSSLREGEGGRWRVGGKEREKDWYV